MLEIVIQGFFVMTTYHVSECSNRCHEICYDHVMKTIFFSNRVFVQFSEESFQNASPITNALNYANVCQNLLRHGQDTIKVMKRDLGEAIMIFKS